jgi:hypothetical protein
MRFGHLELKNQPSSNRWKFRFLARFPLQTLISTHQDPIKIFKTWIGNM